jgi:hypothetical protein
VNARCPDKATARRSLAMPLRRFENRQGRWRT